MKSDEVAARRHRAIGTACATALALAAGMPGVAVAADVEWVNASGGAFTDAANWSPAVVPDDDDTAIFDLNATFAVTFPDGFFPGTTVTNERLRVDRGEVTLDLRQSFGNNFYQVTDTAIVGGLAGQTGRLAVRAGSIGLANLIIGDAGIGVLTLSDVSGGSLSAGTAAVGTASAGVLNVGGVNDGSGSLSIGGALFLGGDAGGAGSAGTLNLGRTGSAQIGFSSSDALVLYAPGVVNLDGGTLQAFRLDDQGGTINFDRGGLFLTDGDLVIGDDGPITTDLTLDFDPNVGSSSLSLGTDDALVLNDRTVTIDGGSLSAGSIDSNGGQVIYNAGVFALTDSGLIIDARSDDRPLGDSVSVDGTNSNFSVSGPLVVGETGSGSLAINGGFFFSQNRSGELSIAAESGSTGTVSIGGADSIGNLQVSGNAFVGGSADGPGGTGTLTVGPNGTFSAGDLTVYAGGVVDFDGGTFSISRLDDQGGAFNYTAGSLSINEAITIGGGAAIDQDVTLTSFNDQLGTSGLTSVDGRTLTLAGGTLQTGQLDNPNGGSVDFQSGQLFINSGTLTLTAGAPLGPDLTLDPGKTLGVSGTPDSGTGIVTIAADGSLSVTGGNLTATRLVNNSPSAVAFTGGQISLGETLVIDAFAPDRPLGATVTLDNGQTLQGGTIVVGEDGVGTFAVAGGSTVFATAVAIAAEAGSTGTVTLGGEGVGSGTLFAFNRVDVGGSADGAGGAGTLVVGEGGFVSSFFSNTQITVYDGGSLAIEGGSISGPITRASGGTVTFDRGSVSLNSSDLTIGDDGLFGADLVLTPDRSLSLFGNTTIEPGASLAISGGSFNTGTLDPQGSLTFDGGSLTVQSGGLVVDSGGLLTASVEVGAGSSLSFGGDLVVGDASVGSVTIDAGGGVSAGGFDVLIAAQPGSTGTVVVDGSLSGSRVVVGGRLGDDGNVTAGGDGTLAGGGSVGGSVFNLGVVAPGGDGIAGRLDISGDYVQDALASLEIELGGLNLGGDYDSLFVAGFPTGEDDAVVTLGGLLGVSFIGGFESSTGHVFTILQTRGFEGALEGEFFGLVDGSTFDLGNRMLTIDYGDFGVTLTDVGAVIPEPSGVGLLVAAGLGGLTRRRRRR